MKFVDDDRWIEVVLVFQEHAWRLDLDTPRLRRRGGEIALVVGDDHGGATFYGRGEDMTVLGMGGHFIDERFVTCNPGVAEVFPQLGEEVCRFLARKPDPAFEISDRFGDDFIRPARTVEARFFGKTKKRVAKRRLDQDAGVQDDRRVRRQLSSAPSGRITLS